MLFLRKGSGFIEITGLFGRAFAPPKMASASASMVKQLFGGAEVISQKMC